MKPNRTGGSIARPTRTKRGPTYQRYVARVSVPVSVVFTVEFSAKRFSDGRDMDDPVNELALMKRAEEVGASIVAAATRWRPGSPFTAKDVVDAGAYGITVTLATPGQPRYGTGCIGTPELLNPQEDAS